MFNYVEHEKRFITSSPGHFVDNTGLMHIAKVIH